MRRAYCFFLLLFLVACAEENSENTSGQDEQMKMEHVFRVWQEHLDKNEFAEVRKLSTAATESLIGVIEDLAAMLPEDSTRIHTEFKTLNCVLLNDTSGICYYSIEDEEQQLYQDSIEMRRRNGQWLVHSPLRFDEGMEDLLDELFEEDIFGESPIE